MHPQPMLREMVADRRRELLSDAEAFRRNTGTRSPVVRSFPSVRRFAGHQLVRLGQALAGVPGSTGIPAPAGRQS